MAVKVCVPLCLLVSALSQGRATYQGQDENCEVPNAQMPASSSALLQVQANKDAPEDGVFLQDQTGLTEDGKSCSYNLIGDQDGSKPCQKLKGKKYTSGKAATLDEAGYQTTAKLCCHHEMSMFVRREIERQGFDVCDLSDLHGFVHWYDCTNDKKSYSEMKKEIAGIMTSACPWLGHLPDCPKKDPVHCGRIAKCDASKFPTDSMDGASASLNQAGYRGVAKRCCQSEMEKFIKRLIGSKHFYICDEGSFKGFLHWFDCTDDDQNFEKLVEGITIARSGLPPMCPWLGSLEAMPISCPPKGHNCPVVEVPEPAAHRRRTACR